MLKAVCQFVLYFNFTGLYSISNFEMLFLVAFTSTTSEHLVRMRSTSQQLETLQNIKQLEKNRKNTENFSPFDHRTQVDTSWSQVICICVKFTTFCDLRADLRIRLVTLVNPYASSGFSNLRWLASICESVWPALSLSIERKMAAGAFGRVRNYG